MTGAQLDAVTELAGAPDRSALRSRIYEPEASALARLIADAALDKPARSAISAEALRLVEQVREAGRPSLLEGFLTEYGLDSAEGLALMSLAEALLRVPDRDTVDALIADKIAGADWSRHSGQANAALVNFSTAALSLTAGVLTPGERDALAPFHSLARRLGEPMIRIAIGQAMKLMGGQFVFGRTIAEAVRRAPNYEREGYRFSYDMLGEAARTAADARRYADAYAQAIAALARHAKGKTVRDNPGISIKLSALHPRYELAQRDRVLSELVATTRQLARQAAAANIGFNIDAEEQARLDISLDVIAAVLADDALKGWDGFGVVVQAYGRRAPELIDWLQALAARLDRRIMVRLVKGAYWDTEIKLAQTLGLPDFPVFTRKAATDVSYIACARRLLSANRIYPQFATHNAHTIAAVLHLARETGNSGDTYEFQRLHGMGEEVHAALHRSEGTVSRIYAPIGAHRDLLAYLVRRLLENGAGASFVHQIADPDVPSEDIARDPIDAIEALADAVANPAILPPSAIFKPLRGNSRGWDLNDPLTLDTLDRARAAFRSQEWRAAPGVASAVADDPGHPVTSPSDPGDEVGHARDATPADVEASIAAAVTAFPAWSTRATRDRADCLRRAADLYEANAPEFFALLAREAGKSLPDAVGEVREAADFLRYYAAEAECQPVDLRPLGPFTCISPWNFPLAIFTGQIAAALAAGNTVLAKPAEATPLVAARGVALMHEAGIPADVLRLLPGPGSRVGTALTSDPRIAGVCFTGSLPTARRIERAMASALAPDAPLIAETGGINAMIVDSTALTEQAVRDIVSSAFQSAGQRCSALRMLYVQSEAAERTIAMLKGAMDELRLGDPWHLATDIGPVIDLKARDKIEAYIAARTDEGRLLHRLAAPSQGIFVPPTLLRVTGIADIPEEIFGPVLHVASYEARDFDRVVEAINASGYGLTFAMHSRIAARLERAVSRVRAGNIYINRNQIGAVVASQPFGGEGLSGTGPKAGGPHYLARFMGRAKPAASTAPSTGASQTLETLRRAIAAAGRPAEGFIGGATEMPGPTGEANTLRLAPRGLVLCLGPSPEDQAAQAALAQSLGNTVVTPDGAVAPDLLAEIDGIDAVMCFSGSEVLRQMRASLARRDGPIIPLITDIHQTSRLTLERHVCTDLTASGGNPALITAATV